jgi:hypothetical protein
VLSASEKLKSLLGILEPIKYTRDNRRNPVLRDKIRCGLEICLWAHRRAWNDKLETAVGKGRFVLTDELLVPQHLAHRKRRLRRDRHPKDHDAPTLS